MAGALLAALAAAVTAFETLIGFPQLEKLYQDAARNLDEARVDWEDVDPDAVPAVEVERVEDVFRSERGQWGQLVVEGDGAAADRAGTGRAPGELTWSTPTSSRVAGVRAMRG